MNHLEFKRKYILLLYQTSWKFIDSPAVLEFFYRFEVASDNPILSPGKIINITYGELTFNISRTIISSGRAAIINLPPGELILTYSLPRLRIAHSILLNPSRIVMNIFYSKPAGNIAHSILLNPSRTVMNIFYSKPAGNIAHSILLNPSRTVMNIFYSKPAGNISHAKAVSITNDQVILRYNTISLLRGVFEFITIPPGSFSVVCYSPFMGIDYSVGLSTSWAGTLIFNLGRCAVATPEALQTSLIGSFTAEIDLDIFGSVALSTTWTWPTNNMFIVDILVGSGKKFIISYLQASVIYSTIISIYRPIYISYYDDSSLLSDVENMTLEEFSYKQFTP